MTAKTVARDRLLRRVTTPVTAINVKKVTRFRGEEAFEDMVQRFMIMSTEESSALEEEEGGRKGRQHWEPRLASLKIPRSLFKKDESPASKTT